MKIIRGVALIVGLAVTMAMCVPGGAGAAIVKNPVKFKPPVVLPQSHSTGTASLTCYNPCGEPSLVKAPDGTLYVSTPRTLLLCCNSKSSPVWKSPDDGKTWSDPIFPSAPESATTGGDTELAVDKRGTVYEGELWLGSDSIYISSDQGQTWSWSPASHDALDDREWFVYSPTEDALYGVYDAIKGIQVVKAPLDTPLATDAASFFPIERVVFPEWDDCPALLTGPCQTKPGPVPDEIDGMPVLAGLSSPGRPSVSPIDGTLYFPVPYQIAGKGIAIASTNDGLNYTYTFVTGAGHGVFGDTGNDFPVSAVDAAGNLYVSWVEDKGDGLQVYLSVSRDKGTTWTGPFEVSKGKSNTAVFPNVSAGANGRVAVSWFGSSTAGDPNNMPGATWNVYTASSINALADRPKFTIGKPEVGFHTGNICTHGAGCTTNDRKLLDFFDMQIDAQGALLVVFARDPGGLPGAGTDIAFSKQSDGCSLTRPKYSVKGVLTAGC